MDDNLPQKIQSYQIVRVLGKGGMGAVYEGINPQLGRRVAIKVLLSQFSNDKEQVARFFNEAKASNLVRHPSLVDVFECGYAENGTAFIIMEYLDGETLRTRCKRQGALGGAAIPIIRQMATALAATHEKNIVHRDAYRFSMTCFQVDHDWSQRRRNKPCSLTTDVVASLALT